MMVLYRELVPRKGHLWISEAFNENIGGLIVNFEAAYIQCIGWPARGSEYGLKKKDAPFELYLIDASGWPKECANYH